MPCFRNLPIATSLARALAATALLHVTPASAADPLPCRDIRDDAARLACYDAQFAAPAAASPTPPPDAAAAREAPPAPAPAPRRESVAGIQSTTPLSHFWELEDKQGTFKVLTYQPNYVLPLNWSHRVNRAPHSPTRPVPAVLPDYRHTESIVQLSLRAKVAQELLLPGADLWFGYTHRAQWQLWTGEASRPFRNTDYEPEFIYVVPTPRGWQLLPGGWRWQLSTLALTHQSNGQTNPLSRSWNRVTLGAALEHGEFGLQAQLWRRIREKDNDDNPDLTHFIGRGELRATWQPGAAIAALTWRTNFKDLEHGSVQLDWTVPVVKDQPQGLRWYVRAFHGYGESLLDYNFRKTSLGAGVMLLAW